jgi:hypothetical protein
VLSEIGFEEGICTDVVGSIEIRCANVLPAMAFPMRNRASSAVSTGKLAR